jgi:hypothetical protein
MSTCAATVGRHPDPLPARWTPLRRRQWVGPGPPDIARHIIGCVMNGESTPHIPPEYRQWTLGRLLVRRYGVFQFRMHFY